MLYKNKIITEYEFRVCWISSQHVLIPLAHPLISNDCSLRENLFDIQEHNLQLYVCLDLSPGLMIKYQHWITIVYIIFVIK